jgi:hypothetical protein
VKYLSLLLALFPGFSAVTTPWERYLEEPSPTNASLVTKIEYSVPDEAAYSSDDLGILKLQVLAADESAFQLAFRLYGDSEGGLAEELGAILASTIRPNPEFFLSQASRLDQACRTLNVDAAGIEYVDRLAAQAYELRMRTAAIESVEVPALAKVKCSCLARLSGTR